VTTESHPRFEDRLLDELRAVVAEAPPAPRGHRSRRRRRILIGAAAATVAACVALGVPLLTGGGTPAYAVSANADGSVTVEISSLADAAGLERKLRDAGVPAVVRSLPPGKMCKAPWFTPAGPGDGGQMRGGVEQMAGGGTRFTIDGHLPADVTLVIATQQDPSGASAIAVALAQGAVGACTVVDAPAGAPPFGPPPPGAVTSETGSDVTTAP
jgi:hypothetical protein